MSYGADKLKMGINLDFQVKFYLADHGRSVHKTIGTLTKVFCIFGPNLVILAWKGVKLSRREASDWHTDKQTDTHTDAGNDNTLRPKLALGKNSNLPGSYELKIGYRNISWPGAQAPNK